MFERQRHHQWVRYGSKQKNMQKPASIRKITQLLLLVFPFVNSLGPLRLRANAGWWKPLVLGRKTDGSCNLKKRPLVSTSSNHLKSSLFASFLSGSSLLVSGIASNHVDGNLDCTQFKYSKCTLSRRWISPSRLTWCPLGRLNRCLARLKSGSA